MEQQKVPGTLIIGAGIAGLKSALELADRGIKVYLCDNKSYSAGTLGYLDKWFPDNHCGICKILPVFDRDQASQYCLRQGIVHQNIEFLSNTEIKQVEGEFGKFRILLVKNPPLIKSELCIGCGLCEKNCPIEINNDTTFGTGKSKAVSLRYPLSLRKTYEIAPEACTKCGACVDICPVNAINLHDQESKWIEAGTIIVSTGFEEFDPASASQYGYKRYPNVVTSLDLERMLSNSGPTCGTLVRPSDGKLPASIAFLQCVGSRDTKRNYCSSACCMYAIKEASMIKELHPEIDIQIFYMDIRAFGKGYHRYYDKARDKQGIRFVQSRIPVVNQDFRTNDLLLNTLDNNSKTLNNRFEMVVLSVGQTPSPKFKMLTEILGLTTNKWGYGNTDLFGTIETEKPGIYICGSASGPKDIADTIIEAGAAAGKIIYQNSTNSPIIEIKGAAPKIAVLICNCKGQMNKSINISELKELSQQLPGVTQVEECDQLCDKQAWQPLQTKLEGSGINHVLLAACSIFRPNNLMGNIQTELVNIREEGAWVHQDNAIAATSKAKNLITMAFEKIKGKGNALSSTSKVTQRALVIGAGLGGLIAATSIAEQGFEVELIEKTDKPGGHLNHIYSLLEKGNPQEYLTKLITKVQSNPLIHLRTVTDLTEVSGYAGNFKCIINEANSSNNEISAGAIVVASGANEYKPGIYLYGQVPSVITQHDLEEKLASGQLSNDMRTVVMIQCVGSRDAERPYCSRICCTQALKNALELKQRQPETKIIVFYRDLMSYGFKEEYYTKARDEGVLFVRYELDRIPEVTVVGDKLQIQAIDPSLNKNTIINPDLLVLSTAIVPNENKDLAEKLGIELTEDGFFKEAEVKFRPVDSTRDGIYICGLAHSPRSITETICQAQAVAHRAITLLHHTDLFSGRLISHVNERRCSGCELCIAACPYNARFKDNVKGIVKVLNVLCQGCGACVTACPNGAAGLNDFTDKQIFSMMDVAI